MRERHLSDFRSDLQANLFLRSLSPGDAGLLAPRLSRVHCRCGQVLGKADNGEAMIYFPERIVVGLQMSAGRAAVALVGREGLVGWADLLGADEERHRARVMMGGGTALSISAARFHEVCLVSPTLNLSLLRFVQALTIQMSWSIVSARGDSLMQRLSALLLMIHDRIEGDHVSATHRALAAHLGVRRASVTDTLHILEGEHALRSERGRITIRSRELVERFTGASYGSRTAGDSLGAASIQDHPIRGSASPGSVREPVGVKARVGRLAGLA